MNLVQHLQKLAGSSSLANADFPVDIERFGEPVLEILAKVGALSAAINLENLDVTFKQDNSVLTNIDLLISEYITQQLEQLTGFPVVSEESINNFDYAKRASLESYWLVDPLDGTRGFAKGGNSYCHMVSFIHKRQSVFACILLPKFNNAFIIGGLKQGVYTGRVVSSYKLSLGADFGSPEYIYTHEYKVLANKDAKKTLQHVELESKLVACRKIEPANSEYASWLTLEELQSYLQTPNGFNNTFGAKFLLDFYRNNLCLNYGTYVEAKEDGSLELKFNHGEQDLAKYLADNGLEFVEQLRTLVATLKLVGIYDLAQGSSKNVNKEELLAKLDQDLAEMKEEQRTNLFEVLEKFKKLLQLEDFEIFASPEQTQLLAQHKSQLVELLSECNHEAQAALNMAQTLGDSIGLSDKLDNKQFILNGQPLVLTSGMSAGSLQDKHIPILKDNLTIEAIHSAGVKTYEVLTRDNLLYFLPTCVSE